MPTTYAIPDGRTVMAATLYNGNSSTQNINNAINGVSFQPDFVWTKPRNNSDGHGLMDSVRGRAYSLQSNTTGADQVSGSTQDLTAFNSNGFALGTSYQLDINTTGNNYIGWQWKANGTAVSNTSGSITSQVSANTTAGFSVVTYTGTSGAGTVGHGLGVAPAFIIAKSRNNAVNWITYHVSTGNSAYMNLNTTNASASLSNYWGTSVNSSTFGFLSNAYDNANGNMVAYCFASIAGYSNAFSYTGNGSTDGPFLYLGFRPRWVMIKRSSSTGSWEILDTSRNPYNDTNLTLEADLSSAESTGAGGNWGFDILSNGFKIRGINSEINTSGQTYIGFAVAENPFKFANAR